MSLPDSGGLFFSRCRIHRIGARHQLDSLEQVLNLSLPSSFNESSLLIRLKGEDEAAWHQLVELIGPLIFHWCGRCKLSASDSSDVMQDVLISAHRKIDDFQKQKKNSLRGWLWRITQNRIMDHFRRADKRQAATGGTVALDLLAQLPDDVSAVISCLEKLKRAFLVRPRSICRVAPIAEPWSRGWT